MLKEKFIEKCEKTHIEKYFYDKVPQTFKASERPYFKIGCPICKEYWSVRYDQFQAGSNCPNCTPIGRKKYPDLQLKRLKEKYPNLDFSETIYIGADKDITFKCKKHGKQTSLFYNLLNRGKYGCPICDVEDQKTTKEELELQIGNKFSLALVDKKEITAVENIFAICNTCGKIFRTNRRKLVNSISCPTCGIKKRAKTKSLTFALFLKEATKVHKNHYSYFEDFYYNATKKALIRCNWCRHIFWQSPQHHLAGNGCVYCNIERRTEALRLDEDKVINNIKTNLGNRFMFIKLVEKYKNCNTKAVVKCNICNSLYTASCMVLSSREIVCKSCFGNYNIAEERVKIALYKNGITNIKSEIMFNDLVFKTNLRIDIFLPDYMVAIEVQGPHHDKPYRYSEKQTDEDIKNKFEEQLKKDQLKAEWCKKHNVRLITIPYSKIRRSSGVKTVINGLLQTLVKQDYVLQDIEKGYQDFVMTEKLESLLI